MTWLKESKTILFDVDGTVMDTLTDLTNAYNVTLAHFGKEPIGQRTVAHYFGNGVMHALAQSFGDDKLDEAFAVFDDHYAMHRNDNTKPYEGILDLFKRLKATGYQIGLVSNKLDKDLQVLVRYWFGDLIDVTMGQTKDLPRKPAPDMVYEAMKRLQVKTAIYVGDTEVDIQTGHNAGLPVIGVTWGFRDELPPVEALVHTVKELEVLLLD